MRADKGKRFELGYCLLGFQATLICDTQIGYCNSTPAALVPLALRAGDRVKYLQEASSLLYGLLQQSCLSDD